MPAAVVAVAAAFGGASIAAAIGLTGVAAAVVGSVIAMGISSIGSSLLGLNEKPQSNAGSDGGILVNDASPVAPIPVVYGYRRLGTKRVFMKATNGNKDLHLILALCEGPIESIDKIYFNDQLAWAKAGLTLTTAETDSIAKYSGKVTITTKLGGTGNNTAITIPDVSEWTSDHKLKGTAYFYVKLTYDRALFQGVPVFYAEVRGIQPKASFSTGSTLTYPASANPVNVLYDYLTNTRYGKAIDPALIDIDSFTSARDWINSSSIEYIDDVDAQKTLDYAYQADIGLTSDETLFTNVKNILSTMNAMLVFSNGLYRVVLNKAESSVFDFNKDNIIGRWDITLGSKQTKYNRVKINYADKAQNFNSNIIYADSPTYRTEDGGSVIEREISLPGTTDSIRSRFIGTMNLYQSRYQTAVAFTAAPVAFNVDVGEIVTITHEVPGWESKPFRVMSISLEGTGLVRVSAIEYNDAVYTYGTAENPVPYKADPAALDIGYVYASPAPTSLSTSVSYVTDSTGSVKSYISASWTAPAGGGVAYYVMEYKLSTDTDYTAVTSYTTSAKVGPLPNGTYTVRVSAYSLSGAKSDYLT